MRLANILNKSSSAVALSRPMIERIYLGVLPEIYQIRVAQAFLHTLQQAITTRLVADKR